MNPTLRATLTLVLVGAGLAGPTVAPIVAHEVPSDITVLAFIRPEGRRLRVLVRVPLEAIRDIEFPLRGPGFLRLDRVQPLLDDAARLWIADYVEVRENDVRLGTPRIAATRLSLPSDRSFTDWGAALAHVTGPALAPETELVWQQALLDVLLEYDVTADSSAFAIHAALAHLGVRTTTVLRFLTPAGTERAFEYTGDPGLVRLDPRWQHALLRFVRLGFLHILDGIDHLLFVLCLVIPFRRVRPLIAIVTAFTVAHSITLVAAASGLAPAGLWFPPLIETLIAVSIVWLAFENIVGAARSRGAQDSGPGQPPAPAGIRHRWLVAFGFGLVHGFGFSFVLRDSLQFAGSHLAMSLFSFNVGVELGQLLVVLAAVPALNALFRWGIPERVGTILLSALVAHTAWHWMAERFAEVRQYEFRLPAFDAAFTAGLLRALMLGLIVAGAVWLLRGLFDRLLRPTPNAEGASTR